MPSLERHPHLPSRMQSDKRWSAPRLGERVASIRVVGVPVGTRGVVIALHPSTGCVEVIWDEAVVRMCSDWLSTFSAIPLVLV